MGLHVYYHPKLIPKHEKTDQTYVNHLGVRPSGWGRGIYVRLKKHLLSHGNPACQGSCSHFWNSIDEYMSGGYNMLLIAITCWQYYLSAFLNSVHVIVVLWFSKVYPWVLYIPRVWYNHIPRAIPKEFYYTTQGYIPWVWYKGIPMVMPKELYYTTQGYNPYTLIRKPQYSWFCL